MRLEFFGTAYERGTQKATSREGGGGVSVKGLPAREPHCIAVNANAQGEIILH